MQARFFPALISLVLIAGCSDAPSITYQDEIDVIRQTAKLSVSTFGSSHCVVTRLRESKWRSPMEQPLESEWVQEGLVRYRELGVSEIQLIPDVVLEGLPTTKADFGCSRSIRIERPNFYEVEKDGKSSLLAIVNVDSLCGPVCGKEYAVEITKEGEGWQVDPGGLTSTGTSY